jgi:hypothetical protein
MMTKPVTCLCALAVMLSVIGCNSETTNTTTSTTDSSTQPIDNTRVVDTNQVVDTEQPTETTTTDQPAAPKAQDAAFHKVLSYKNISFTVAAKGKGSLQQLTIQPSGLSVDNRAVTLQAEPVVGAEVGDLNADGYPELLVFTQSAGSGSYGKVVAYSVNNGKSMSRVTFPATSDNAQIKEGYRGHDRFTVVNNQLTQTFPLYKEGDTNSQPTTGKDRVVTYKLKNGEASRIFVVDQVKEVARK